MNEEEKELLEMERNAERIMKEEHEETLRRVRESDYDFKEYIVCLLENTARAMMIFYKRTHVPDERKEEFIETMAKGLQETLRKYIDRAVDAKTFRSPKFTILTICEKEGNA